MKKILQVILAAVMLCTTVVVAKSQSANDIFIEKATKLAKKYGPKYHIPPSAIVGMSIYESGYGKSDLARIHNNYFGIKAFSDWPGRVVYASTRDSGVRTMAKFRAYSSMEECFKNFCEFVSTRDRYKLAFYETRGPGFVRALAKNGYCPDSTYAAAVRSIILRNSFDSLD